MSDNQWQPASAVAREFNKSVRCIRIWCTSGFMVELGYRVRRDHTGHWFIAPISPSEEIESGNSGTTPLTISSR